MKAIFLNGVITSIRSKVDKSIAFSVSTPELSKDEVAMFFQLQGINVKLLIEPTDTEPTETYEVDKDLNEKTPSTRMRSVLYRIWEQDPQGKEFRDYYRDQMEKIIEYLKGKIKE